MYHQISEENFVDIVGDYNPSMFGYDKLRKGLTPADF
jgi:hypothetical protein